VVDRLKFYLLQIQDDVGYVLNNPGESSDSSDFRPLSDHCLALKRVYAATL